MNIPTNGLGLAIKKRPVLSGAVAVGVVLGLFLYYRLNVPEETAARLADRSAVRAKLQENITNSAQLENHLKVITEINDAIAATALKPSELTQNQAMFFALEASTGVKLTNFSQGAVSSKNQGNYTAIPFSFDVKGDYRQIYKCLQWVENNKTLSRVVNAGIRGEKDGAVTLNIKLNLLGLKP
jgi:Tfp pilus assembly protein PilO